MELDRELKQKLVDLACAIVDQKNARVLVPPHDASEGFWFGGGNMLLDDDGSITLCGRYRDHGDSRTGTKKGERGLELALFRSDDFSKSFEKTGSFSKAALEGSGPRILSIEGTSLHRSTSSVELFVSTEKDIPYPEDVAEFQKPGTGVWSIDVMQADCIPNLDPSSLQQVLVSDAPSWLHVKDPVTFPGRNGEVVLLYCCHPHTWASSNTGLAVNARGSDGFLNVSQCVLPRGPAWDVAVTRVTNHMLVPALGAFRDLSVSLFFYDGAECIRSLEENDTAVSRPRGYSCEEIGGLAFGMDSSVLNMQRLSVSAPLFVSPNGTGCSRYVSTLITEDAIYACWQQSRDDLSQPLVGSSLPMEEVEKILTL